MRRHKIGTNDKTANATSGPNISGLCMTLKSGRSPDCNRTEIPLPMEAKTKVPGMMPKKVVSKNIGKRTPTKAAPKLTIKNGKIGKSRKTSI